MYKQLLRLFIISSFFFYGIIPLSPESSNNNPYQSINRNPDYILSGDILYKIISFDKSRLYNNVAAVDYESNVFYYLRSQGNDWIAGLFRGNSDKPLEFAISARYEKLYKFTGFKEVFYILAESSDETVSGNTTGNRVLLRFNPDKNQCQTVEGVMDFILLDGRPVILKQGYIDYNGTTIPHMITGEMKITNIIDSRILFISNGKTTEVIDLLSCAGFYQYADNQWPDFSDEYNLILEFTDKNTRTDDAAESGSTVYYEIVIDGAEDNRTETGRGEISKLFHAELAPGKYHIIKPERWELDKSKGRYMRVNNIYQPGELKILVPEKRIIKVRLEFDGSVYRISQSVMFRKGGG